VASTLLDLAGRGGTLGEGGSLVPALTGRGGVPDTVAYLESIKTRLFYGGSGLKALRSHDTKFIWAPQPELYDLAEDPGETRNLAPDRPADVARWQAALGEVVANVLAADHRSVEAFRPDAATMEGLRSLGYLGGSGTSTAPLPFDEEMALTGLDPKDLVDVSMGAREIQNGYYANGEAKLLRFFRTARTPAQDPGMARLWAAAHLNYAKIWFARRDYAKAAEQYGLSVAADSSYDLARWSRVYALNLAGEPQRALDEARIFLASSPQAYRVLLHAGLALALLGRTEEARAMLERVRTDSAEGEFPAESARWYLARLGGPREKAALRAYLERRGSAASSGESG
jgi:tetratricopeptide (TPR) repeat protein